MAVEGTVVLDAEAIGRTVSRIAHEVIERNPDLDEVALVGIQTRGVPLAQRLRRLIAERAATEVLFGAVDITFHRDDLHVRGGEAPIHAQPMPTVVSCTPVRPSVLVGIVVICFSCAARH